MHVSRGSKHILNIYKYNKTGSILKIEPFFCAFFHRKADERSTNFKIVDELIVPTIIKDNNEQD